MNAINLGHGYRLVRRDAKNWETQHWHCAAPNNPKRRSEKPAWHGTGNYFQRLDTALAWVYEQALREDDGGECTDLQAALDEARSIAEDLKAAAKETQIAQD